MSADVSVRTRVEEFEAKTIRFGLRGLKHENETLRLEIVRLRRQLLTQSQYSDTIKSVVERLQTMCSELSALSVAQMWNLLTPALQNILFGTMLLHNHTSMIPMLF